jgi:RNA polymerase sigma-70 factor, ECF subfamily
MLRAWGDGDRSVGDELLPAVYTELHRLAARAMRRESSPHTLQPTALINEAYLRLDDQQRVDWRTRAHFFGVAAQMMRRILVDHARSRLAEKRGGDQRVITLEDHHGAPDDAGAVDVMALHDALERLAGIDPFQARLVELRYFGGLNIEETAEALEVSPATMKREWVIARAWLRRELAR